MWPAPPPAGTSLAPPAPVLAAETTRAAPVVVEGEAAADAPDGGAAPMAVDLEALLLAVVAEKTGYPAEMLELDMDARGRPRHRLDQARRDPGRAPGARAPGLPSVGPTDMAGLRTLGQIVALHGPRRGQGRSTTRPRPPPPRSRPSSRRHAAPASVERGDRAGRPPPPAAVTQAAAPACGRRADRRSSMPDRWSSPTTGSASRPPLSGASRRDGIEAAVACRGAGRRAGSRLPRRPARGRGRRRGDCAVNRDAVPRGARRRSAASPPRAASS